MLRKDREANLRTALTPAEGQEVLRRVLAAGLPHVYVSTRDLPHRIEEIAEQVGRPQRAEPTPLGGAGTPAAAAADPSGRHARPELASDFAEPEGEVEEAIAEIWSDLLGIAPVGRDDDVFELGGNSLLLMQLSVRLRSMYGVALNIRQLFEVPTVASLGERVESVRLMAKKDEAQAAGEDDGETEEIVL